MRKSSFRMSCKTVLAVCFIIAAAITFGSLSINSKPIVNGMNTANKILSLTIDKYKKNDASLFIHKLKSSGKDFDIDENGVLVKYTGIGGNVVIPDGVKKIGDEAFEKCKFLTGITIPESVTSIGSYAFSGCNDLTSITIPKSVTSMGCDVFKYSDNLTNAAIEEGSTAIVDSAFSGCSSLKNVSIPSSVTSIGFDAFYGCSGLCNGQVFL